MTNYYAPQSLFDAGEAARASGAIRYTPYAGPRETWAAYWRKLNRRRRAHQAREIRRGGRGRIKKRKLRGRSPARRSRAARERL